jgi:hypothetical protein
MRRSTLVLMIAAFAALIPTAPAAAAADHSGTVSAGTPFTWVGTTATGVNTSAFAGNLTCGKDPTNYCDGTLLQVNLPIPDSMLPAPTSEPQTVVLDATVSVTIDTYAPDPLCDFDLNIFSSDATGTQGDQIDSSGNNPGEAENVNASVESTATVNPDGTVQRQETTWLLVQAVYFTVPQSNYKGSARLH